MKEWNRYNKPRIKTGQQAGDFGIKNIDGRFQRAIIVLDSTNAHFLGLNY